ncbi:Hypothetical protein A7982_00576 [Minicystis rosea]|nr:Hypothetical protein A7982_00576 [Minicystis rosea]
MSRAKSEAKAEAKSIGEQLKELLKPKGRPSRPLLGVLPIRRVIPQDLHALGDYADAFRVMAAGLLAKDKTARAASLALGTSSLMVSSLTDHRISVVKLIPIEAHQVFDYVWSTAAIAAPFVLGYRKRAPLTATLHILVGATHLVGSLFTDYRSARRTDTEPERIGRAVWKR